MKIKFNELLDYDQFPNKGKHNYYSSKVVELEFIQDEVTYIIKCHIDFKYWRWYYPETYLSPEEDECELIYVDIDSFQGYRDHKGTLIPLSDKEMRKLKDRIKQEIIFE